MHSCWNVAWQHQNVQEQASDFFVSFYSASCLSLRDLVQRFLGQPVDVQAPWPSAAVIPRRRLSPEELGRVGERSLGSGWTARLSCGDNDFFSFFFFKCLRGGEDSERGETKFSAGVTVTAATHHDACRRETAECSQRRSEVRAGRLSSRFRLRAYRTVQTTPVSSRSVHHGIFPDFYFYTHSLQRPHERRPMASRREQVSALFFVAWTQRHLTECFPWATEGPNPPKETLTFKKEFFWQTTSGSLPAGLKSSWHQLHHLWFRFCVMSKHCWRARLEWMMWNSWSMTILTPAYGRCIPYLKTL